MYLAALPSGGWVVTRESGGIAVRDVASKGL